MIRKSIMSVAAALMLSLVACGAPGTIKASEVEGPIRRLIKRHDAYTEQDKSLSDVQRRANLRDGAVIETVLKAAENEVAEEEAQEENPNE